MNASMETKVKESKRILSAKQTRSLDKHSEKVESACHE